MSTYQNIIIGLDLSQESSKVLEKASAIASAMHANVIVAHVLEPIAFAYGGDVPINLSEAQDAMEQQARRRLSSLVKEHNLKATEEIITIGQAASELHHIAETKQADLIIVGSHGRHGLALLLGSTANGVLHGANCDVLAIRV